MDLAKAKLFTSCELYIPFLLDFDKVQIFISCPRSPTGQADLQPAEAHCVLCEQCFCFCLLLWFPGDDEAFCERFPCSLGFVELNGFNPKILSVWRYWAGGLLDVESACMR